MPFVTGATRRELLRWIGAGAAVLRVSGAPAPGSAETRWALLSDTHISADPRNEYRGFRPYDNLKRIAPELLRYGPDGVIIDGDLARLEGLAADYSNVQELIAPVAQACPVAMTLGNHDDRNNFRKALASRVAGRKEDVRDREVVVIEHPPVRYILLDSLLATNQVPGLLGKAQRTWLESYLASAQPMPTLLFVHHTLTDNDDALLDADRFLPIATRHSSVKAIFYGHSHAYAYDTLRGVHLVNLPAVGYNFRDNEPVGWLEARFTARGCNLTLNAIGGNMEQNGKTRLLEWRA